MMFFETNVIPNIANPNNSDIFTMDHINQSNIPLNLNDKISAINTKAIVLYITLKDKFGNIIEKNIFNQHYS